MQKCACPPTGFFNRSMRVLQTYKFIQLTIPSHFHLLLSFLFHISFIASRNSFRNTMEESNQWNKLTRDLEILVLERLTLLDLRRLSFTCKYFQSLVSDPSFAIHYDGHRVGHRTLVVSPRFFGESIHGGVLKYLISQQGGAGGVFKSLVSQQGRFVMLKWESQFRFYDPRRSQWFLSTYGDGFTCFERFEALRFERLRAPSLLLVFNPLFPHEHRTLTTPAMADCSWGFHIGIAYDRKNRVCKLVLWLTTNKRTAFDGRLTSFVYNFEVGTWKKIPELNIVHPLYFSGPVPQFLLQERFLCWFTSSTLLVFDVEEDSWTESILFPSTLLDIERFVCVAEHKKQLCVIGKTFGADNRMIWGLWKFDRKESVWKVAEFIRPPPIQRIYCCHPLPISGDRDFLWLRHWNLSMTECSIWVYDISHDAWQCACKFTPGYCLEASLFRLTAN